MKSEAQVYGFRVLGGHVRFKRLDVEGQEISIPLGHLPWFVAVVAEAVRRTYPGTLWFEGEKEPGPPPSGNGDFS